MKFFKLSPEQKRLRKKEMFLDWKKQSKKPNIILYELRTKLAEKYDYKNEKVVQQTIIRMEKEEKEKQKQLA